MQEIELKLALPACDPAALLRQLQRTPLLARRKATTLDLHNIYFDTPEQALRQQRVALRLRRVGSAATPHWLQTLKTGGRCDSALSQRGEWEVPVDGPTLSALALQGTPWPDIDPEGKLWATLVPCFETSFVRTCWRVRRRDGSVVEVAFDHGRIVTDGREVAICELELELLAGEPAVLFDVARDIARAVPVLPLSASKAERGFALAQGARAAPQRARPPALAPDLGVTHAAQQLLREAFAQFLANLYALHQSDDPEVVHQARVGWRRFRSLWRLFRPALASHSPLALESLQALLDSLGRLRDLDVARSETLPSLQATFVDGQARRGRAWQAMLRGLVQAAAHQRAQVLAALSQPSVGECLLATTQWIEGIGGEPAMQAMQAMQAPPLDLRSWARQRLGRLWRRLQAARRGAATDAEWHRVRILAKRLRYGVDALRPMLPKRRAQQWQDKAAELQGQLGQARDRAQAARLVAQIGADPQVVAFLQGVAG